MEREGDEVIPGKKEGKYTLVLNVLSGGGCAVGVMRLCVNRTVMFPSDSPLGYCLNASEGHWRELNRAR